MQVIPRYVVGQTWNCFSSVALCSSHCFFSSLLLFVVNRELYVGMAAATPLFGGENGWLDVQKTSISKQTTLQLYMLEHIDSHRQIYMLNPMDGWMDVHTYVCMKGA